MARRWFQTPDGRSFLIESIQLSDLEKLMAGLPRAKQGAKRDLQSRTQLMAQAKLPKSTDDTLVLRKVEVALAGDYQPKGVILDYRNVATSGAETLATGETVYVAGSTYLTTLTIQPGWVVKYADDGYLLAYSGVNCLATAANPASFAPPPAYPCCEEDVFVHFSDDSGSHWSDPVRVNDDATTHSQFLPRLALDQTTGNVAVCWQDASADPDNRKSALRVSLSKDGGRAFGASKRIAIGFSDSALSPPLPSCCYSNAPFDFGDYESLDFHAATLFPEIIPRLML